jgi:23S rRNA (guanosine2251-2'-O)-methyltransferase
MGAAAGGDVIPGRRAVLEALRAGRPIRKILIARTAHGRVVHDLTAEARRRGAVVQYVHPRALDELSAMPHQGVVALTAVHRGVALADILAAAAARGEPPLVLVLDGVEDPRNLGALIRTAEAAGAHGVVIPGRRAAGLSPAVARASAGAVEHVPVAVVGNLVQAIEELKAAGVWVAGADPQDGELYTAARLSPPLALVMGGEGRGLGRLVKAHCDLLVRLPMRGKVASLNVAVAAGVLLFEALRQMEQRG